ncbi:hypothetical protein LguiB_028414 [Lonicera macranthoides]
MDPKSQASSSGSSKPNPSSHPFQSSDFNPLLEPMEAIPYLPREIQDMIFVKWIKCSDKELVTKFLEITLMNYGLVFRGIRLHPTYPFLSLFHIHRPCKISIHALVFLWYLTRAYTICFVFDAPVLLQYLRICIADLEVKSFYEELYNPTLKGSYNFLTFLQWFKSPQQWIDALQTHHHRYCLIQFNKPMKTPHPKGDNAQITKWFPRNLAKSIKEPENVAYVTFLQEMCALNKVDYDSVPNSIKFGNDPWITSDMKDVDCLPLFECLYTYVQKHFWDEGEQSSDTIAFVGLSSDSNENREPDPEEVQNAADFAADVQAAVGYEENMHQFNDEDNLPDPNDFLDYDADTDNDYPDPWQNPEDNHWYNSPKAPYTPNYSGNETD